MIKLTLNIRILVNKRRQIGFSIVEILIAVVIIGVIGIVGYTIYNANHKTTPPTSTSAKSATSNTSVDKFAILPPATVPSLVPECSQAIDMGEDGSTGPGTCSNGDLNVLQWQELNKAGYKVMTLGRDATIDQVQTALCKDRHESSNTIAETAYEVSVLYYGWKFSTDPTKILYDDTANC